MTARPRPGSPSAWAARRADLAGIGPTVDGREPGPHPGAVTRVALFGEVMLTGVMITIAGLAVVTLPAALAAGTRHLRLFVAGDRSAWATFWREVRAGLTGGAGLGAAMLALTLVLAFNIHLAGFGFLPGGEIVTVVSWAVLAAACVALVTAADAWTPETGWRSAIRAVPAVTRADLGGALYRLTAVALVGYLTWTLTPLLMPSLGCLALALVAIPHRPRRRA